MPDFNAAAVIFSSTYVSVMLENIMRKLANKSVLSLKI